MQDVTNEIKRLAKAKNALILAHNYQAVEIQDLADYRGDSLQLSILSAEVKSPLIVFCGVRFMAETAAILNPGSKVILPVKDAGCPMADMISGEQLRQFKAAHPGSVVVCYVNSTVEVKAESDICCTSSNALKVVSSLPPDQTILFVPDRNLGSWVAKVSGRKIITWNGYCPTHQWGFSLQDVQKMRGEYPDYELLVHPESDPVIVEQADHVMSTGGMVKYLEEHDRVIIATENGLTDYLKHLHPDKKILSLSPKAICQNMKKTRVEDVLNALQNEEHQIQVDPGIAQKAKLSIDRMLAIK
ncbi:MAG: quinolinate synthase NadA [Candidatus Cloacimonetes bacterium]|nr:quinolinate synthase NadA [Candidatus Cloacimonadota bacterium]MDD4806497.1 quinolinate synthase NadA [Candidatus Cloacimonadota bacterium]